MYATLSHRIQEDALNYAEQDIKDRWEFYKERYFKKIKK